MDMYQQATLNYQQLDEMLRSSFAAIRRDIDALRAAHTAQMGSMKDLQIQGEQLGKFNTMQVKFAEQQESLRKLEQNLDGLTHDISAIQKSLKTDFKEHEKQARGEYKEYKKSVDADLQTLNRKIETQLVRLDEKLTESVKLLDKRTTDAVLAVDKRTHDSTSTLRKEVSKFSEIQQAQGKIDAELNTIRQQMAKLTEQGMALFEERARTYGERVAQQLVGSDKKLQKALTLQSGQVNEQLNEQAKQVNAQMSNVKASLDRFNKDQNQLSAHVQKQLDEKISRGMIEKLVDDINREFNTLKQLMVKDFQRIDEEFKRHGKFMREKKFKTALTEVNDEFDRLKDRVNYIDTSKISKGYFDQQLDELRNDMATVKDELMVAKATAMADHGRKDAVMAELRQKQLDRSPARKRAYRGMSVTSTTLLLIALALAIIGAATHFSWGNAALYYTLSYIGGAMVAFVIGLILRMIVWNKRRDIRPEEQTRLTEVETGDAPF